MVPVSVIDLKVVNMIQAYSEKVCNVSYVPRFQDCKSHGLYRIKYWKNNLKSETWVYVSIKNE